MVYIHVYIYAFTRDFFQHFKSVYTCDVLCRHGTGIQMGPMAFHAPGEVVDTSFLSPNIWNSRASQIAEQ